MDHGKREKHGKLIAMYAKGEKRMKKRKVLAVVMTAFLLGACGISRKQTAASSEETPAAVEHEMSGKAHRFYTDAEVVAVNGSVLSVGDEETPVEIDLSTIENWYGKEISVGDEVRISTAVESTDIQDILEHPQRISAPVDVKKQGPLPYHVNAEVVDIQGNTLKAKVKDNEIEMDVSGKENGLPWDYSELRPGDEICVSTSIVSSDIFTVAKNAERITLAEE